MNIKQLKDFCRGFPAVNETLYGEPSNILVYSVGGKTFAYFKTSDPERWRFSTRVTPERFVELTDFPSVKPARYRGRFHWVTIVEVPRFPAAYLTELVEWSYHRAFASLGKARQVAIRTSQTQCHAHLGDAMQESAIVESTLTCPVCGFASVEIMPTNACIFFHECANCHSMLRPQSGDCCVFCSYGSVKCPPAQQSTFCCGGTAASRP